MWKFLVTFCVIAAALSCKVVEKPDGVTPRREQNPSHVLLEVFQEFDVKYWCSGVLISTKYVLTTANCVFGQSFINVHIYAHNFRDVFEADREIYKTSSIEFKPGFDGANYLNDVALIKLPVKLNLEDKPYQIATLPDFSDQLTEGREGVTVGWGLLNFNDDRAAAFKNEQVMKVVSDQACREAYPKWNDESLYQGRICIKREDGNNCVSDNGSPFLIGNVVYGLQSFGQMQACEMGWPNGIQEVRYHAGWVAAVLASV